MQHGVSLHEALQQAKPTWSPADLQAAERKLAKIGIATCAQLSAELDSVNGRLQDLGLQRFSPETIAAMGRTLQSCTGPNAGGAVQVVPSGLMARLQASHGRGTFAKPGLLQGGPMESRLQKGGKGRMGPGSLQLSAAAGITVPAGGLPGADQWDGWSVADVPRKVAVVARPLAKERASKAQTEDSDDEEDGEDDEEKLSDAELKKLCSAKAIPFEQLQSTKKAPQLLQLFERLEKSPASTLKNEYKTRGFAPDVSMRKEALLTRVKEVVLWEHLEVESLRRVCEAQGLPADDLLEHGQLLQVLSDLSWAERGVPLPRLPNLVVAHGVLDSISGLSSKGLPDLLAQAKRLSVPLEAHPDKEDVLQRLRTAMVWKQMDANELRKDCEARGAPLDSVQSAPVPTTAVFLTDSTKAAAQERKALEALLMQSLWLDVWAAAGISAKRLGSHARAGELFQAVEKLRRQDMPELQESFQELNLPLHQCAERRFILQRLSEALFWKALPQEQLRQECEERGLAVELRDDEAEERQSCVRALLVNACAETWAARGIPVKRLASVEGAATVAEEWARLEGSSDQDLKIQCELHGLPKEAGLEKEDIISLLREVAVWEALPLQELRRETAPLDGPRITADDEWTEHGRLVERLLLNRCAGAYDAKGIPANRLGSLKAAAGLAGQWGALDAMETEGLRKECLLLGMPAERLQRQELLPLLRDVALWKLLPLADLQLTCRSKGVAPPPGVQGGNEETQRALLVDALLVERCEAFYERRGIPVRRLGSVQAAARIAERWEKLESMSPGDLLLKASAFGVHAEAGLERTELMDRLKSAMLWHELPLKELQKECRHYGVNSIAHEHERKDLALRLAAALWAPAAPPPPPRQEQQQQQAPPPRQSQPGPSSWQRKPAGQPPRRPIPTQPAAVVKHLKTLGLPATATGQEIRKAYKRLALRYHPDKNLEACQEEAARRFREVAEAYAALAERVKGAK